MVGKQLDRTSLRSVRASESGGCKRGWVEGRATELLRLLVAIEVADLSRVPLLVEVLDAVQSGGKVIVQSDPVSTPPACRLLQGNRVLHVIPAGHLLHLKPCLRRDSLDQLLQQ